MAVQKIHTIRGYSTSNLGVIYTCPTGRVARIRISAHFIDFYFSINSSSYATDCWLHNVSSSSATIAGGRYHATSNSSSATDHYILREMETGSQNTVRNPGIHAEFLTLSAGETLRLYELGSGSCNYHLEIIEEDNI